MTKQEKLQLAKEVFPSFDIYKEAQEAALNGGKEFTGTDGILYQIPSFMLVDAIPQEQKPTKEKKWFRDENGNVNLDNYQPSDKKDLSTPDTQETDGLVFEEQVNNKELMASLKRRFGDDFTSTELLDKWASEQHYINYNLTQLAYDASRLDELTKQEKRDYLLQLQTWDKVKAFGDGSQSFWDQTKEISGALFTDPTTYVGVGTLGAGFLGKTTAKAVTKEALISFLSDSVKQGIKKGATIGAIDGAVYSAADNTARQVIEQKATDKIDKASDVNLDVGALLTQTALGAAAGTVIGGALGGVAGKFSKEQTPVASDNTAIDKEAGEGIEFLKQLIDNEEIPTTQTIPLETPVKTPTQADAVETPVKTTTQNVTDTEFDLIDFDKLPDNFKSARGYYGKTQVIFSNDVQKAVYFSGNTKNKSVHYETYLDFASKQLGISKTDVVELGKGMRNFIKEKLAEIPRDQREGTFDLSTLDFPTQKKVKKQTTTETPKQTQESPSLETKEITPAEQPTLTTPEVQQLAEERVTIPDITERTPAEGGNINLNRTSLLDEKDAVALLNTFEEETGVKLASDTKRSAIKKMQEFKTQEDVFNFLNKHSTNIESLDIDGFIVRTLFANESNKLSKLWGEATTVEDKVSALVQHKGALVGMKAITQLNAKNRTMAGRFLKSMGYNTEELALKLDNVNKEAATILNKVEGLEKEGKTEQEILSAFTPEELKTLQDSLKALGDIAKEHDNMVRQGLREHDRNENIFRKAERVLTEIWLASNLFNLGTQSTAVLGSVIKRATLKTESYLTWLVGKTFGMKERMKWNELMAYNEASYGQSLETARLMFRMLKGGSEEGQAGILQREALDGWATKWDDPTSHGAIYSGYIGYENPDSMMKQFINNGIDGAGNFVKAPFTTLSLIDDAMKRTYYLPMIKYHVTKLGNQKFPNDPVKRQLFIEQSTKAYEIFYTKRGRRANTIALHVTKKTEELDKAYPNMDNIQREIEREKFVTEAEKLVEFTPEEQELLKRYPIDDVIHEKALGELQTMLFQKDIPSDNVTVAGRTLGLLENIRNISPIMQTQLPYLKTIVNMARDTFQRFPVTWAMSRQIRADLAAGGEARANAVSKLMLGSAITAVGFSMAQNGTTTPSFELDQYQINKAAGVEPGAINIIGNDIPLNRVDPTGLLQLSTDLHYSMKELNRIEKLIEQLEADPSLEEELNDLQELKKQAAVIIPSLVVKAMGDKYLASSIKETIDILTGDSPERLEQWLKRYTTGFIPAHSLIKSVLETEQGYEAKSFIEHVRAKIGILGKKYGDRETLDYLGEINNDINKLGGIGWRVGKAKADDFVLSELYKLQPGFKMIDSKLALPGGITLKLDYKDTYELRSYLSHPKVNARETFKTLLNDKAFQALPNGISGENTGDYVTKVSVLRDTYSNLKTQAKTLYLEKNEKALLSKYEKQVKILGIKVSTDKDVNSLQKIIEQRGQ